MTSVQTVSLVLLALCLLISILYRVNIGVLTLAAAFPVLLLSHTDAKDMYSAFPGDIFVLIAGVSLLFAHLEASGALRAVIGRVYDIVGDRQAVLPWVTFTLAAALSTAGAFSTAVIAFLVPTVAHLGTRYRHSFYLCELATVIAANSAGLSPLNPTGAVVRAAAHKAGMNPPGWGLWLVSIAVAAVVVLALQIVQRWRGPSDLVPAAAVDNAESDSTAVTGRIDWYAWAAGAALLVFLGLVLFAKTDVGITSIMLAALLQLLFRRPENPLLERIPWRSILLLCGVLTYLGLLQQVGTMDSIAHILNHLGKGAALILVIAYLTTVLCNIESSTIGVLGLMMPIVFSTFGSSPETFWVVAAVCVPAALMVMNPIHVAGTLIIANTSAAQGNLAFRRLLALAATLAAVVPGLLAIIPIVI